MLVVDSPADLEPIIAAAVQKTLEAIQSDQNKLGDRLAFSETEAAALIGIQPYQLRDERLRGRVGFTKIVGRRIRYDRKSIMDYLNRDRTDSRV